MKWMMLIAVCALTLFAAAQVPNKFNYQAIARNNFGQPIPNASINVRISILDGGPTSPAVYSETRLVKTNQLGLFTIAIGSAGATTVTGSISAVQWSTGNKYIQVEADPLGGDNFVTLGNTELLSVPYALYSVNSSPGTPGIQGPKGDKGDKGDTGPAGPTGATGAKGDKGDKGDTGPQGLQGIQGAKGDKGDVGPQGATGPQGLQGVQGDKGDKGDKGDVGPQGATGPQGIQGVQGDKGDKGDKGDVGPQGATGPQGIQGLQGDKGDKGDKGDTGPQGIQGEKGDKGDQGIQGRPGTGIYTGGTGIKVKDTVINALNTLPIWNADSLQNIGISATAPTAGQLLQFNGSVWAPATPRPDSTNWHLTGNTGTTPANNFIGTIDQQDFVVKTNNNEHVRITANGDVGIGTATADALQVAAPIAAEYPLASSNVRLGVLGTPRMLLDAGSGYQLFEMDNASGRFRLFSPGAEWLTVTQNGLVGMGTSNPRSTLDVWGGNISVTGGDHNGTLVAGSSSGTAYLGTNTLTNGIAISPSGYVGIGLSNPGAPLHVYKDQDIWHSYIGGSSGQLKIGGQNAGGAVLQAWNPSSNTARNLYLQRDGGRVGIGTTNPLMQFEVYTNNDVWHASFGGSTGLLQIGGQTNNGAVIQADNPSTGQVRDLYLERDGGNVGIGTNSPTATLDVNGNMSVRGSTYFGGDIRIGGNVEALRYLSIGSGGDAYPLAVEGHVGVHISYNYYDGTTNEDAQTCNGCTAQVSIIASNNVMATEYDCVSDERIKNIKGVSNNAADLDILNKLQVTDYTMKDKATYGMKPFKKVIAQQVEKIYPQAVSKNVNYIPNVYMVSSKIEKTDSGYLLTFNKEHHISATAYKLKAIDTTGYTLTYEIVNIPAKNKVLVKGKSMPTDRIFIYGEEVNDFRTVDYEALTTLNMSATQQLSTQVNQQQKLIDGQAKEIDALQQELAELKKLVLAKKE